MKQDTELQFKKALQNLKEFWGYESFRSGQAEAVKAVFAKQDTLALFPTGGGKSLCYQVPATVFEGLTLVISPLVALMQDQVQQLHKQGISATFINNTIPFYEVEQRLVNARNGMYKLLYCAPERLGTELFQNELPNLQVHQVAIDEAHCISEWGHDFRPAYRKIKEHLDIIKDSASWIALTATATPVVKKDILTNLGFVKPEIVSLGFARPNLKWWVVETPNTRQKLIEGVVKGKAKGDGLIYGGTRKNCEYWADFFTKKGLKTEAYHAGIESEKRKKIQQRWIEGTTPLVVATNAFGMGIDKPDCRYVIHESMPYSLEAYYQEAGRAGRDGEEAFPILYYKPSDYRAAQNRIEQSYPTYQQLSKVYSAICDTYELAEGAQMQETQELNLEKLKVRSHQSLAICRSSLRLLEQFGVIALQQHVPPAFSVQFTMNREMLHSFKEGCDNIDKAEFVDRLERFLPTHAFFDFVQIPEEDILKALEISRNGLIKALNVLMQNDKVLLFNVIEERDLVRVLEARSTRLPINKLEVEQHREVLLEKLEKINAFVNTDTCREVFLRNYFGDPGGKECGTCDNCVKNGVTVEISEIKSQWINETVKMMQVSDYSQQEIQKRLKINEKESNQLISYLIKENKIIVSDIDRNYYSLVKDS